MPNEFTPEWYERTLRDLIGVFQRASRPPALDTGARMLYMLREQGKSVGDAEQWLAGGGRPEALRPGPGTDMIDLRDAAIHNSPDDVMQWPITVHIVALDMLPSGHPRAGLNFTLGPVPDAWDYHVPGWGGGSDPGNLLYTVWAAAQVAG